MSLLIQRVCHYTRSRFSNGILPALERVGTKVSMSENKLREKLDNSEPNRGSCLTHRQNEVENSIYFLHCNDINSNNQNTIIYSHGNGYWLWNSTIWWKIVCPQLQCNCLIYDYSGYGLSTYNHRKNHKHLLDEELYAMDIECVFNYLVNECKIPYQNIFLYGSHIGTSPTIDLCVKLESLNIKIGGIILESTVPSYLRIDFSYNFYNKIKKKFNFDLIDVVNNYKKIEFVKTTPILFIHDKNDRFSKFEHILEMYQNVSELNENVADPLWTVNSYGDTFDQEMVSHPDCESWINLIESNSYYYALNSFIAKNSKIY